MTPFEFLSVLVSIIVGLGISHLLSNIARLIQAGNRVKYHAPTLCWMGFVFLLNIQVWWASFDRRGVTEWSFAGFMLYLLIPIGAFLLSYLTVPELAHEGAIDLGASFAANRVWLFGILTVLPLVSVLEERLLTGTFPFDLDALFRLVLAALSAVGWLARRALVNRLVSYLLLALFCGYIVVLFSKLP